MTVPPPILLHGLLIGCCIIGGMLTTHLLYSLKASKTTRCLLQILIALLLLHSTLLLLTVGLGTEMLMPLRAILAALLPPWIVLVIRHINRPAPWRYSDSLMLSPALLALITLLTLPGIWLDGLLIGISLFAGLTVLALSRQAGSELAVKIQQSLGLLLIVLAAMDAGISFEMSLGKPLIESVWLNVAVVLLFAAIVTLFLLSLKHPDWLERGVRAFEAPTENSAPNTEEQAVMAQLEQHLQAHPLYLRAGLTIGEVADATGYTRRMLSQAINRTRGCTFSALMNDKRIKHVTQRLTSEPDTPITTLMYESGFNTKSSFHREFTQREGCSPSDYRQRYGKRA